MLSRHIIDDKSAIQQRLKQPYLKLDDALDSDFAEGLREELLSTDIWKDQGDQTMAESNASDDFKYSRKGITMGHENNPKSLLGLFKYLNQPDTLQWMSDVSGRRCDFFEGSATIFKPSDHISRHSDVYTNRTPGGRFYSRALTFNYWLVKDWESDWGGRLVWEKPFAEIVPTFNTLVLFLPTQSSMHWVEPVADFVTVPRLAVSGWFMTDLAKKNNSFSLNIG